ncbi:hyaluronidase [Streptococcus phage Javan306]|uniref:phage tail spike protein n=1 Tax=Streptococcus mitis TaxID=28037 RepID=UPI000989C31C|nr:phage tail spike protein [Streptococcus mitis]QBX26125.1 hyaluronidase [Streptococcus phage Javan306]
MLYLLESDTRNVKWNGIPLHEATSAIIKEQMNGDFTLTLRYPITDSEIYQLFREDMLIKAPAPVIGPQLFRIKKPVENDDHLEITAYHITDDVMQRSINPLSVNKQSCWQALSQLVQVAKSPINDFSFTSDITDRRTINTKEVETLYSVLMDGAHSIVGTWEGELVRDNFAISIKRNRGEDRGVIISTHKNLKSYQRTKNSQNVVTRIHAKSTFKAEGAKEDTTIAITVDSPLIGTYPYINERSYTNNNIQTVEELTKWASAKFTNEHIDKATDAIKIEAYELDGQTVHMGDTVNLKSYKHNVDIYKKAIAYEYDCLANNGQGAYLTITFDDKVKSGGNGGGVSAVANAILDKQETQFDIMLERAIANADRAFDAEFEKRKKAIDDAIEIAKAKAEEVKQELSDTIDQRFDSFDNASIQEARRKAEEALKKAGASSSLAQEAKQIGLDSIARLEAFKSQATSAQTALSGDLDALKQTVTSEVNQASEYRRTTTEALSRMTGQMKGFATKSEVAQGIDGLTQTFAKMKVGSRNYAEDYDFSRGLWNYSQGDNSPQDWTISNGEYNVKGTTKTWKQMQIYSKEGSIASGKSSTALLELELGETYTLSFQAMCHSGNPSVWVSLRANRTAPSNPEIMYGNFNLTSSWQTYQVTIPALTKPDNFDFWRIILGYNEIGHVAFRKVELTRSSTRIDAGPAPEDGKTDLIAAKSTFEKTAEGLSSKLATVETYVSQDGQRQEALQRYTREESARQATAVRELVAKDYVGKATYQETVRAIENKFEAITNPQNGSIATQIANYKTAVDGRFADITSLIAGKASQTDFQKVKETSQLYERIIGSTENDISNKVARMAMTSQLFQVEVAKNVGDSRNYVKNADFRGGSKNWRETNVSGLNFNYEHSSQNRNKSGVHIYGTSINARYFGLQQTFKIELKKSDKITLSFLVSKDGLSTFSGLDIGLHYRKDGAIKSQAWREIPNSEITASAYKKLNFNYELPVDIDEINLMFYGNPGKSINLYISEIKLETGSNATPFTLAPEDTDEAVRTVQNQLAGSWAVQNINSAGDLISGLNLGVNGHNRLDGKLTHITGETLIDKAVIKSAMVDKLKTANFEAGSVTTTILDAEAVTAEKLKVDNALIRKITANEAFIDQLTSKRIFATKIESVISSSTVLEGYKGWIGGFQLGTHDSGYGRWITGRNHFSVGMGDGTGGDGRTALWVNWGNNWNEPGYYAWFVKNNGKMYCYNTAEFWKTPIIHGDLKVTGRIHYDGGVWIYSGEYEKIGRSSKDYFYLEKASGARDWFPAWNDTSDRRLKSNIQESNVSGIDIINRLKTYSYRKEFNNEVEDISCGIMAQDVQKYAPDAFREGPDGIYTYNTFALVPYLIKAIQELNQKIEKMEKTIA